MKRTAYCAILLCAGCATTDPAPVVTRTEVQTVKVVVPASCLKPGDIPPLPKTAMRRDGDLRANAAGAAADLLALQAWSERALVLLNNCAKIGG